MLDKYKKQYNDALLESDMILALDTVHQALKEGITPEQVIFDITLPGLQSTMDSIMYNLDENLAIHYLTAQISVKVTDEMLPLFKTHPKSEGCVIVGTVAGDLHSLGKRIVGGCLKTFMFDVVDLGVNVSAEQFVQAAVENNAQVIGLSSMMVHTARGEGGCLAVRKLLDEKGLSDKIKIIVGGAPFRFDSELYKKIGADDFALDGVSGAEKVIKLIKNIKS